ncbi:MAG TPA: LytTR family DNA-binding domain-containing protein [Bacteroidales bacterium]|nr:LytTR family DNA-binding domain-containing protein [Bacteroidales bacterium]
MLRAVIVEDEKKSQDTLIAMLNRYCPQVVVTGIADGVESGLKTISTLQPDLLFLDIQMPDGSGFKLLELLGERAFQVIFITAFDQYAIKAIRYSALDYLLKPIIAEELIGAVEKAEKKKQNDSMNENIRVLLENVTSIHEKPVKIVLSTSEKMYVVDIDTILRCESDNYYTRFYFTDGKNLLVSKTLKEFEELLKDHDFIRPHKSHLVNLRFVRGYHRQESGQILMTDGSSIPVSRRKRDQVLRIISHL